MTAALARGPFDDRPDPALPTYGGLPDLLADEALRAVVLPAASPLAPVLPELVAAGLAVLLPDPAPWEADLLREARAAAAPRDVPVAVLFWQRHTAWVQAVDGALVQAPVQVTVRGWPRGPAPASELVDLVRRWCGDVVAAAALGAPLPADVLPGGAAVAWALLTDRGTTVLVSHEGPAPLVRLSSADRRLEAGPAGVAWADGEPVALPVAVDGATRTCRGLAATLRLGTAELVGASIEPWPWPADLGDLVPVAGVLEALRTSARSQAWAELA